MEQFIQEKGEIKKKKKEEGKEILYHKALS